MAFFADGETDTVSANGSVSFCNCCMPRRRFLVGLAAATAMSSRRAFAQAPEAKPCPYRKPHPASEQTANRVMFVPDDRFSHVAGMRADQALPIEGTA